MNPKPPIRYTPRPEGIADRVLTALRAIPPGAELSTQQLHDRLSFHEKALSSYMAPAVAAGLVFKRMRHAPSGRRALHWSLVDLGLGEALRPEKMPKATAPAGPGVETANTKRTSAAPTFDARYQVAPGTKIVGGWSTLGIGRYL